MIDRIRIHRIDPADRAALMRFVRLERLLTAHLPYYTADPDSEVAQHLSGRTPYLTGSETALFVATDGDRDVARCAAIVNPAYQALRGDAVGSVGRFATAPGASAAVADMLGRAEAWLGERGVTRVIAPYDGSVFVGYAGLRTAGFDEPAAFPMAWQPPYFADQLRDAGYEPRVPLYSYEIDLASPAYQAVARRVRANRGVTVRPVPRRTWKADIQEIWRQIDATFAQEWEYAPSDVTGVDRMMRQARLLTGSGHLVLGQIDGRPAGFLWAMPDLGAALRTPSGSIGPLRLARAMVVGRRTFRGAGLLMMGVLPDARGRGVAQAMAVHQCERYRARGLRTVSYHFVNAHNAASRSFAEAMGGVGTVLWHLFEKHL